MKKEGKLILVSSIALALLILLLVMPSIIAATTPTPGATNLDVAAQKLGSAVSEGYSMIRLDVANSSRLLLGLLLWMILFSILKDTDLFQLGKGGFFTGIASLIMTVLAFMFIPPELIIAMAKSWGPLGATILTFLPFIIMAYFTVAVTDSLLIARIIWGVFLLYWIGIFAFSMAETGSFWNGQNMAYILVMLIGVGIFAFLEPLRGLFFSEKIKSKMEKADRKIKRSKGFLEVTSKGLDDLGE